MDSVVNKLQVLSNANGISGDEKQVSKALAKYYEGLCDEIVYDNLGSIFAVKKSGKKDAKKVMVCAHMDEVGLMVKEIHKNGLVSFLKIGPIADAHLLAQRVTIQTRFKAVSACVVMEEENLQKLDAKVMKLDLGCSNMEEVKKLGVAPGDMVVFDTTLQELQNERVIAKAMESRVGCSLGIDLLQAVKEETFDFDLYVGASVMKEVGIRGATTATGLIQPDLGIVLDCDHAHDLDGKEQDNGQLGKGVLIRYYDKGMMPNRGLLNHFVAICEKKEIAHQYYYSMGQNDGAWIHKLFSGCPTLSVGICARNLYSANAMIDVKDYQAAKQSLCEMVKQLDENQIEAWKKDNQ